MKRFVSILMLSLLAAAAASAQAITAAKQVATVKLIRMENITVSQLKPQVEQWEKTYGKEATKEDRLKLLDGLINRSLIEQAAERDRVVVSDAELKAKIDEYKRITAQQRGLARDLTDAELQSLVKATGITWDAFTRQLKYGVLVANYVRIKRKGDLDAVKPPTDQECRDYYDANKKSFFVDDSLRVRQIYLDTRGLTTREEREKAMQLAQDILRQLRAGAAFADLAAKYSEDTTSKYKGGEMGWIPRDATTLQQSFGKDFWEDLFKLKPGQLSDVLLSGIGLHVVQCEELVPAHLVSFDDRVPPQNEISVKEFIRANLLASRQQAALYKALDDIIAELRKAAEIKVFEDNVTW